VAVDEVSAGRYAIVLVAIKKHSVYYKRQISQDVMIR
jgi:hypothetical protein